MNEKVKGRIYDIQGYSVHDGPGIRTTVFLKGCPLTCLWCHSPESQRNDFELAWFAVRCVGLEKCGLCLKACPQGALSQASPEKSVLDHSLLTKISIDRSKCDNCLTCASACPSKALTSSGYDTTVEEVYRRVAKDRHYYGEDGGITISGGEPMAQFTFTYELAKRCKQDKLSVCLDTTGYAPGENYDRVLPYIDLFLFDLKHMDTKKSRKFVGAGNDLILANAKRIAENGGKLQIRIPVIPKLNASNENLIRTAQFCQELGQAVTLVQLLPYHAMGISKYVRIGRNYKLVNITPPSDEEMQKYLELIQSFGLPAQIH
ncbi:glycyl-radical enzyme activating protein [Sporomusa acidovorans]|uniref:4-hydroxyphenylacetate decarboxylase activating enzyme n=1 Tax=Sporomusa acidovorans (strain ATCC 49682 / DSM 3132 / Mol) TaxID=1123286 RepID=A0ABZ3J166_SPOA4|nr:glycyl-radical enzyme activating protein [Sporomusa acidovorans]OZC21317.1 4-hydroxyphenylacetate decarboxylase activating enzyme [Sporomusa acidovorans DSM 3132]SDE57491.1 pyruvate formate lyase activating enzyme [Sporomusa acidovorans]